MLACLWTIFVVCCVKVPRRSCHTCVWNIYLDTIPSLIQIKTVFNDKGNLVCEHFCRFQRVSFSHVLVHSAALSSIITSHRGVPFFKQIRFYVWAVSCVYRHKTSCFKSHLRRLGNVHLVPYPRGLHCTRKWKWNLCHSASTGSQVHLTTPQLTPDKAFTVSVYFRNRFWKCHLVLSSALRPFSWLTNNDDSVIPSSFSSCISITYCPMS